jgi:zinc/manganese transport system substrate-binding protein
LAARLEALDQWIRAEVATVEPSRRVVVTSHDAFSYYGAAYGVRFLAPQGVTARAEPSAQQVAALIRQIRAQNISAVFVEGLSNPATLRRLAAEAGVRIQGSLYADTLSGPDGPAATHEAMLRHNTALMVAAMRGDAG